MQQLFFQHLLLKFDLVIDLVAFMVVIEEVTLPFMSEMGLQLPLSGPFFFSFFAGFSPTYVNVAIVPVFLPPLRIDGGGFVG